MLPAIITLAVVVVLFFTTYFLNRRTDVPLEAHEMPDRDTCMGCDNHGCRIKQELESLDESAEEAY